MNPSCSLTVKGVQSAKVIDGCPPATAPHGLEYRLLDPHLCTSFWQIILQGSRILACLQGETNTAGGP